MSAAKDAVIYMPILKWKQGEHGAVKPLVGAQKIQMLPLAEIPDRLYDWVNGVYKKTWDEHLDDIASKTRKTWGKVHEIAVDLSNKLPGIPGSAWRRLFAQLWDEGVQAIPVVSTSTSPKELASLKAVSEAHDRTRWVLRYTLEPDAEELATAAEIAAWFESKAVSLDQPHAEIDAVLDLGHVGGWNAKAVAPGVTDVLAAVAKLGEWRTLTLASGAFPKNLAGLTKGTHQVARTDWAVYTAVRPLAAKKGLSLVYGDYGVSHVDSFDGDPRKLKMSANIRYACPATWSVFKARAVQDHGFAQYINLCQVLTALNIFRGAKFSQGDLEYHKKANDPDPGPGNATTWRRDATNHHIHVVLEQLASPSAP